MALASTSQGTTARDERCCGRCRCLALEPLGRLRDHRLEADDFDRLAIGDPVRDLLTWMSDAEAFQTRCDAGRWATFRDVCLREFSFDPERDGTQAAADALLQGGGKWDEVWKRFCDAPQACTTVSRPYCVKLARATCSA